MPWRNRSGSSMAPWSVAALFNNCADCFKYVQLGRRFKRDYERCQLRLDIAKTRLGRWGEAVKINDDPRSHSSAPTEKPVRSIMEEIGLLLESARKTSERYELIADQQDLVVLEETEMKLVGRALHSRLKDVVLSGTETHETGEEDGMGSI